MKKENFNTFHFNYNSPKNNINKNNLNRNNSRPYSSFNKPLIHTLSNSHSQSELFLPLFTPNNNSNFNNINYNNLNGNHTTSHKKLIRNYSNSSIFMEIEK